MISMVQDILEALDFKKFVGDLHTQVGAHIGPYEMDGGFESQSNKTLHRVSSDKKDKDSVWLDHLESWKKRKGHGTEFMKKLSAVADKHKAKVHLIAGDPDYSSPESSDSKKLVGFYKKFGFKSKGKNGEGLQYMVRTPSRRSS